MADDERTREELEAEIDRLQGENNKLNRERESANNIKAVNAARLQARGDRHAWMLM